MDKQAQAAKEFVERWTGKGQEKQHSQLFWLELLAVLGVASPTEFVRFEEPVMLSHTSFIDIMIPATHTIIEQKSLGKDLNEPILQSDGSRLKPIEQAKRYSAALPYSERPRWIVSCNFSDFLVFDMERPNDEPQHIELKNLASEYQRLKFIVDTGSTALAREMEISKSAGDLVAKIYASLLPLYEGAPLESEQALAMLNKLCVRLVFCLYAEDAGIFGQKNIFHDYLASFPAEHYASALKELFTVLDTPKKGRDPFLEPRLAAFPYVNGSLFAERISIPPLDGTTAELILNEGCNFDWSQISPTIFGAIFESTLNPVTRRSGGMHYTSIENIHRVIDPLFLDEYRAEFRRAMEEKVVKTRKEKLRALQAELAAGKYLDPAAGSGNFLTESYLSLRRLENDILRELITDSTGTGVLGFTEEEFNPVRVSISQFYGIEINDFAVAVAKTALWIAEAQMLAETEEIIHREIDFLPLKSYDNIYEGNALRKDWREVLPPADNVKIMGNPPFVGYTYQSKEQKEDIASIWRDEKDKQYKATGKIDYVACWHFKAAEYMQGTQVQTAFVSTNSITQGEQVVTIWRPLMERFGVSIDFAWRTFVWNSESKLQAHVHCVIIGFSCSCHMAKHLYSEGRLQPVETINPYLLPAPTIFVGSRTKPLSDIPLMTTGNRPADGGALIIEADEYDDFIKDEPSAIQYIKRFMGAEEYINNKVRYCLWLVGVSPSKLRAMPKVMSRVKQCRENRLQGAADRQKLADTPTVFRETKNPENFLIVPKVSSERRRYIPVGFQHGDIIASDLLFIVPDADLYNLGILTSNVHMAWMRVVAGRLKSDYRYSKDIVYNNFPWPITPPQWTCVYYRANSPGDSGRKSKISRLQPSRPLRRCPDAARTA